VERRDFFPRWTRGGITGLASRDLFVIAAVWMLGAALGLYFPGMRAGIFIVIRAECGTLFVFFFRAGTAIMPVVAASFGAACYAAKSDALLVYMRSDYLPCGIAGVRNDDGGGADELQLCELQRIAGVHAARAGDLRVASRRVWISIAPAG